MIAELGAHPSDGRLLLHVETQAEWRAWLERNHDVADGVWLVSWKKATGKPFIPYSHTVDEALCFGWIDSRPNRVDDERAMRLFTPRKPKSLWSRINRAKVARLTEQGRMAPAGLRMVETAKANGWWTIGDEIEDLVIPPDLGFGPGCQRTGEGLLRAFRRVGEEEHPVVDQIGAETRDPGQAHRADRRTSRAESHGQPPQGPRPRDHGAERAPGSLSLDGRGSG